MTNKEALHSLVDELTEDQAELARLVLEDLKDAADSGGPPLDKESLTSLDRGIADVAAGRVKPFLAGVQKPTKAGIANSKPTSGPEG
jgi:hypothetical protein